MSIQIPFSGNRANGQFAENLPISKKVLDEILSEKKITHRENWVVPLLVGAKRQNIDWTFHYNAVYDDNGKPCGVLVSCNDITETEKCISRLNIRDQQFQSLIYQATIGIIVLVGEEMRVEVVNDMYGKLIGRTVDELQGKNLFELIPEAESDFRPIINHVLKTGEPLFLYDKHYFAFAMGEKIEGYLNLVYQPYRGYNGNISGVMVLCHDVTNQVRDKRKIIEAEEKAQLAIESADLGTYEIDLVTDEMKTSERFNKIWGVENNIPRTEFASRIHPDDLDIRAAAHRESIKNR